LTGKRFASNEETIETINNYLEVLEETHFWKGIGNLEKCIELRSNYIVK